MVYSFDSVGKKVIKFKRMSSNHILGYMIYGVYKDDSYSSGVRRESLLKTQDGKDMMFVNPLYPVKDPDKNLMSKDLEYNKDLTWKLPDDAFYGRDYKFQLFINNALVPSMYYDYNRITRKFTINKTLREVDPNDSISIKYWRDYLHFEFDIESGDFDVLIKPVFKNGHSYGTHNVII